MPGKAAAQQEQQAAEGGAVAVQDPVAAGLALVLDANPAATATERMEGVGVSNLLAAWVGGEGFRKLAARVGVSKSELHRFFAEHRHFEAYKEAQRIRAAALVDEAQEIADDASGDWFDDKGVRRPNPVALGRAKLRVDQRRWLAGKLDSTYADDKGGPSVQINIGSAHLDVMRSLKRARPADPAAIEQKS